MRDEADTGLALRLCVCVPSFSSGGSHPRLGFTGDSAPPSWSGLEAVPEARKFRVGQRLRGCRPGTVGFPLPAAAEMALSAGRSGAKLISGVGSWWLVGALFTALHYLHSVRYIIKLGLRH